MSNQWGSGFHAGKEVGEYWGAMFESGKWECEIAHKADELVLLSDAVRHLYKTLDERKTETWRMIYCATIARRIAEIAKSMPSTIGGVYEFQSETKEAKE